MVVAFGVLSLLFMTGLEVDALTSSALLGTAAAANGYPNPISVCPCNSVGAMTHHYGIPIATLATLFNVTVHPDIPKLWHMSIRQRRLVILEGVATSDALPPLPAKVPPGE